MVLKATVQETFRAPKKVNENNSFSLVMLYYGDKYRKMKVLEKIYFFFRPPTLDFR